MKPKQEFNYTLDLKNETQFIRRIANKQLGYLVKQAKNATNTARCFLNKQKEDLFKETVEPFNSHSIKLDKNLKKLFEESDFNAKKLECIESAINRVPDFKAKYISAQQSCLDKGKELVTHESEQIEACIKRVESWLRKINNVRRFCKKKHPYNVDNGIRCLVELVSAHHFDEEGHRHIRNLNLVQVTIKENLELIRGVIETCLKEAYYEYLVELSKFKQQMDRCNQIQETKGSILHI